MKRALQNMISEQQNEVVGKVGKNGLVRIGFGNLSGGGRDFSGKKIWLLWSVAMVVGVCDGGGRGFHGKRGV